MIREYKRIGHFGMVSLLFFIFFFVCLRTHDAHANFELWGGPERLSHSLGTRCSADESTKAPLN